MPVGVELDAHDKFQAAMGRYYKAERDRTELCLSDIIEILRTSEVEHKQVASILARLTDHYARTGRGS